MGLLERLNRPTKVEPAPILVPAAWQPGGKHVGAIMLQPLGSAGFGLRDPETGAGLPPERLEQLGAVVTSLTGISSLREDSRRDASAPGCELVLEPIGSQVVVRDASGQIEVGGIDSELTRSVIAARELGTSFRAVSLFETESVGGRRTGLEILIVPHHVEIIIATE
jgi:hypothetical protein